MGGSSDVRKRRSDHRSRSRSRSRVKKKKSKKEKKRHRSSSSGSSDSDSMPAAVKVGLSAKAKDEIARKKEKEAAKAYETPEEKRARRLAKKQQKELKRRQAMGWDNEQIGYTNNDNPFGDSSLLNRFVWRKKEELHPEQCSAVESGSTIEELEKVKQRRLERERERNLRQEATQNDQRERERAYFAQWESQEDSFHLAQAKLRSKIRIEDGRAKPIDLLAKYISFEDDELAVEMHDPQKFLEGLPMRDLEDLLEDIKVYMELEEGKNAEYWRDITIVVHDEIARLNAAGGDESAVAAERRGRLNSGVANEVNKIFKGKTHEELLRLKSSIENKIQTQTNIDIAYWESLLQKLTAHIARVKLHDRHQETLRRKLFQLKTEQGVENGKPLFPSAGLSATKDLVASASRPLDPRKMAADEDEAAEQYESGRYSPVLAQVSDLPADTVFLDPTEELQKLQFARKKFMGTGSAEIDADKQLMQKVKEGMVDDADENEFSQEHELNKAYLWADKYRPRKPRYFNRVHTGYEWNKYNQTHYDPENPPPKIVQGYKFNIFYPDLIDKRQTPRYEVTAIPTEPDFCVLKFHAGPPYEDIGFKIVNREWEYAGRHGYKCQFSNDIFQLWFKFKTYKYRR